MPIMRNSLNANAVDVIPGDAVTTAELLELLSTSISCAKDALVHLRYDFANRQQRLCVGLLCAAIEYARSIQVVVSGRFYYAPVVLHRAILDAFVDIALCCENVKYCLSIELDDVMAWRKFLELANDGKNSYLKVIAESEHFHDSRRQYASRLNELKGMGVERLSPEDRFERAGMTDEYGAIYRLLSAESHNNESFLTNHYFEITDGYVVLNPSGKNPGSGAPKATLLNVPEILISATEKVLRLCGHGVRVLSPAFELFESIHGRIVAADAATKVGIAAAP